jgi:VCBS repeat-containing protein
MKSIRNISVLLLMFCLAFKSIDVKAASPVALNVSITPAGPYVPTILVAGDYDYFDADGDPENGTLIGWYQASDALGSGAALISGGTTTFNVTSDYRGKYIAFAVWPRNDADGFGTLTYSTWYLVNTVPNAQDNQYPNSVSEGGTLNVNIPGVLGNDTDSDAGQSLTAVKQTNPVHGSLTFNSNGSFTYIHNGSEYFTDAFTYKAYDGYEYSNTATVNISIISVNDPPVLSGIEGSPLPYNEGDPATIITSSIVVVDSENTNLFSAIVRINSGFVFTEDLLSLTGTTLSHSYNASTGIMTISGTGTIAAYQSALRNVKYQNTNVASPNTTDRIITFVVNDGSVNSNVVSRTISLSGVNNRPHLSGMEGAILQYTEDNTGTKITTNTTVTDDDNTTLATAKIFFKQGYVNTEDSLYLKSLLFSSVYHKATGVLDITGTSRTLTEYRDSCLRKVRYVNINHDNPVNSPDRVVSFVVNDGTDYSDTVSRAIHINRVNDPPVASNAAITGPHNPFRTRDLLHADYDYTDAEGEGTSGTTYKWQTATNTSGAGLTTIVTYTELDTFTTRFTDGGKYIHVIVNPNDGHGFGDDDTSAWYYINAAPEMQNLAVVNRSNPGAIAVGQLVSADYDYYDKESDLSGAHTFQWYRSNFNSWASASAISGQTDSTYTIQAGDNTKWIGIETYPYALTGSSPGQRTRSAQLYQVSTLPTATISGNDTICNNGSNAELTIELTGENPPWSIRYTINGANETPVNGINDTPYTLTVTQAGTYVLTKVSDDKYPNGIVSGTGHVALYTHPTATLTTSQIGICPGDGGTYTYPVVLTGHKPWTISIQKQGRTDSTVVSGIQASPYLRTVTLADTGIYHVLHVWDKNCMATGTGSTQVIKKTSPKATMSGDTTVCTAQAAILPVALTGDGPWTFYYTRNGGAEIPVVVNRNVSSYTHNLSVTQVGTYAVTRVVDQVEEGCASGGAVVQNYAVPTAVFTNGATSCEALNNKLRVTLTGISPWSVSYKYENGTPIVVPGLTTSPANIPVTNIGTYALVAVNDKNCPGTATGTQEILPAPEVSIIGLDTIYSVQTVKVPFTVNPTGGSFAESDPNTVIPQNDTLFFFPVVAGTANSPHMVRYAYTNAGTGCIGKDSINIYVLSDVGAISVYGESSQRTRYCFNENAIGLIGVNLDHSLGSFTISGPQNGSLVDHGDNTATLNPSLIQSGIRTVYYNFTIGGQPQQIHRDFTFEKIEGDFTWNNECFENGSDVIFSDQSVGDSQLDSFLWKVYYSSDTIEKSGEQISLSFQKLAIYPVEMIVRSEYNCTDTVRKSLILKPTFDVGRSSYNEDFQHAEDTLWYSFPLVTNAVNSWKLGRPDGSVINGASGVKAWYTDIASLTSPEGSYVESPCFNFKNSHQPMVKMNIWRDLTNNIDGVVLQYSINNGLQWENIGYIDDGVNWYDSYNIDGEPAGQRVGWTNMTDTEWKEARHKLDELNDKTNVRFRIAYGSTGVSIPHEGFAFDNFWVGERTKKVLLEHFTNMGDSKCLEKDAELDTVLNSDENKNDIIDIQYHLGFPGVDTFYLMNQDDALARQYHYTITTVPYGIMDGGYNGQAYIIDYNSEAINQNDLTKAALTDNIFSFERVQTNKAGNTLEIDVDLVANTAFPQKELTLHAVIIENVIYDVNGTNFESVMKAMLPDAGGIGFNRAWSAGDKEQVSFYYQYENVFDTDELRVVLFVQDADEESKEVYQAGIYDPNLITGIETPEKPKSEFRIYPNPAGNLTYIRLDESAWNNTHLEVLNFSGSMVYRQDILPGQQLVTLPLNTLMPGMYLVRISNSGKLLGTEKLVHIGNK